MQNLLTVKLSQGCLGHKEHLAARGTSRMLLRASTILLVPAHFLSHAPCSTCKSALLTPWGRLFSDSLGFHFSLDCIPTLLSTVLLCSPKVQRSPGQLNPTDLPLISQDVPLLALTTALLSLSKMACPWSLNFFVFLMVCDTSNFYWINFACNIVRIEGVHLYIVICLPMYLYLSHYIITAQYYFLY